MSSDTERGKMKGSKPPPPVPPRPSKTLIKEALAKTRQAHGTYVTSASKPSQNQEKSPTKLLPQISINQPQDPEINNRLSLNRRNDSFHKPHMQSSTLSDGGDTHVQLDKYCTRPVVYQSENCKTRLSDPGIAKASEIQINHTQNTNKHSTQLVNELRMSEKIRKMPTSELHRHSSLNDEDVLRCKNKWKKTDADFWEGKVDQKNNENDGTRIILDEEAVPIISNGSSSDYNKNYNSLDKNLDDMLTNRNHVNTLIDEMFASVLEVNLSTSTSPSSSTESIIKESDNKITVSNGLHHSNSLCDKSNSEDDNLTVIIINESIPAKRVSESNETNSNISTFERKVKFNDLQNHEFLINELQSMNNHEEKILKRQRLSPLNSHENDNTPFQDGDKIQMNDWYGVNEGKKVRMSSCHIKIDDACADSERISAGHQRIKNMSREYGLPPLPKSLSGFKFMDVAKPSERSDSVRLKQRPHFGSLDTNEVTNDEDSSKGNTHLDRQLALLRREMDSLREQDLSLLSKLWFLNESIQDFRQMLQDQDEKINLTLSPSPTPSSVDDEEFYVITTSSC